MAVSIDGRCIALNWARRGTALRHRLTYLVSYLSSEVKVIVLSGLGLQKGWTADWVVGCRGSRTGSSCGRALGRPKDQDQNECEGMANMSRKASTDCGDVAGDLG